MTGIDVGHIPVLEGFWWCLRLQFQGVYDLSVVAFDVLTFVFFCQNHLDFLSSFLSLVLVVRPLTLWEINPVNTVCSQEQAERSLTPVEICSYWSVTMDYR